MRIHVIDKTGNKVLILIGQFLVLLFCFIYSDYLYITNILPEYKAAQEYTATQCFIMSKKLSRKKGIMDKYRADFLISYNANGVQYNRWISTNGLSMSYSWGRSAVDAALSKYRVGANYRCWYNPDDPQMALLVQRKGYATFLPLLMPSIIGMVALYYLIMNSMFLWKHLNKKKSK